MNKNIFLILLALFVLTACGPAPSPYSQNYHTGTKGIELQFVGDSPPSEIYEGAFFPLAVLVTNEGATTLDGEVYKGEISYSFDSFYLTPNSPDVKREKTKIVLFGKSVRYPTGDFSLTSLPSFTVNSILGQRENPHTELFVSACYPYKTLFSDEVCIDTTSWTEDIRQTVCTAYPEVYDSQGGPVAVTEVRPEMHHVGQVVRPAFYITIENKGSGSVLAPVDKIENACEIQQDSETKKNWNRVRLSASLSNDPLNCVPEEIILHDQKGFTRCYLDEGGYGGSLNYLSTLVVDLDYVYMTSISKDISIVRSIIPGYGLSSDNKCEPWETEFNDKCIDNCDLCNQNSEYGFCGSVFKDGEYGCNCKEDECLSIIEGKKTNDVTYLNKNCIFGISLCSEGNFCCRKQ
ncbi:MAG: hypothetical protein ABH828_05010 [archaeon]